MKADMPTAEKIWQTIRNDSSGAADKILAALPRDKLPAVLAGMNIISSREQKRSDAEMAVIQRQLTRLRAIRPEVEELKDWCKHGLALERPGSSCVHHARDAISSGFAYMLANDSTMDLSAYDEALGASNCFVVEHDWAAAFTGAIDFDEGEIRLPYDICAFDFKVSGRRVIALITTAPDSSETLMQLIMRGKDFWLLDDDICRHQNGKWTPIGSGRSPDRNVMQALTEFVGEQIRAITIALDAQAAEAELVRVSEKLVRSREKSGHVPPKSYHVVSLARRSRPLPLPRVGGDARRVRLHFRRGHWRHYEDHRTWIKWMLVGDPDLGFVEKEYRL